MNINKTFDHDDEVIKLDAEQEFGYLNTICNSIGEMIWKATKFRFENLLQLFREDNIFFLLCCFEQRSPQFYSDAV